MKIAIFSDVHANLLALESCLESIDREKPDAIYCLGDLVGYNVWPNEVIGIIRQRAIPTIAGNYDEGIGLGIDECGCAYKTERDKEMGKISISYTNSVVHADNRQYLRTLPAHIRLTFKFSDQLLNVLLVHGSPRKINEYLFEDREEKSLQRIIEAADADILCFGHTHKPYHRKLSRSNEVPGKFRHAINVGSVGKPKDGDPRGVYAILHINDHDNILSGNSIRVEFMRFQYDVEKAALAVEQSTLPKEYAAMLRSGT